MAAEGKSAVQLRVAWLTLTSVVVGAVIAGASSFAATFLVAQIEASQQERADLKIAYVDFITEASTLRQRLSALRIAAWWGDQAAYDDARVQVNESWTQVNATGARLDMATEEAPVAHEVWDLLFYEVPVIVTEFDYDAATAVEEESGTLIASLIDEADELSQ